MNCCLKSSYQLSRRCPMSHCPSRPERSHGVCPVLGSNTLPFSSGILPNRFNDARSVSLRARCRFGFPCKPRQAEGGATPTNILLVNGQGNTPIPATANPHLDVKLDFTGSRPRTVPPTKSTPVSNVPPGPIKSIPKSPSSAMDNHAAT